MARKTLDDFDGDYQAYADYLESAECADDEGYDISADEHGNIYERTEGSWRIGHGHRNDSTKYDRDKDDDRSKGRPWHNLWLKNMFKLNLTDEEINLLMNYTNEEQLEDTKILKKKIK